MDWPKLAQTKILADFNLAGGQAQPRHAPTVRACACALARHDTTSTSNMECELAMDSYFQGHHVFKNIWTPTMGEQLPCKREICDNKDRYAVAVL